ncbi:MAG: cell division protein FtsW [Lentisphaerae bacterium]|nr:MAG: cell division protein FtsW [Lentisphaerota bacterium]
MTGFREELLVVDWEQTQTEEDGWLLRHRTRIRESAFALALIMVGALVIFGIVMLYSTSAAIFGEAKLMRQSQWILVGMVTALVLYFTDYRVGLRNSRILLVGLVLVLGYLAVAYVCSHIPTLKDAVSYLPLTRKVNGAYRWLFLGPIAIQPGEFAKVVLILYLADYYSRQPRSSGKLWQGVIRPGIGFGCIVVPMLLGGSLSITVVTCAIGAMIMFVGGVRLRYFVIMLFLGVFMVVGVLYVSPARLQRVTASWLHPEQYRDGAGYQLTHAQYAIGSGHYYGVGLNKSRIKEGYLPYSWTDFIMAVVAEELGWVSIVGVTLAFLLLAGAIFIVGATACEPGGTLVCCGVGFHLCFQAFVNLAVVSGMLPTTGVTVPFVSYGGSSMLVCWVLVGLVASVVRVSRKEEQGAWISEITPSYPQSETMMLQMQEET